MAKNCRINLKDIFLGLQSQMFARLTLNQKILTHPVTKGDACELEWVDMLSNYLPKRYQVEKGFVIDHTGSVSDQIDIIIFDRQYSPFLLRQNGASYIPAESVYAVIEVKPDLSTRNIKYASKKAASVRNLKRTSAQIVEASGITKPKKPFHILAGVLAIKGSLTQKCVRSLKQMKQPHFLNFGCSLSGGSFSFQGTLNGAVNTVVLKRSAKDRSLIFFFLSLLTSLQSLGTVPAMEIEKYVEQLDS